ncbi:hypothetical protein [Paenarthrobacter sp. Y-19]|uniref:hypothetical protein n=1 Tax=Paenarthrobacter sp. Y-19 TaxID=3031125 RepID=UPI0023D993F4|nr:hypothetical protein [Paenarthrobacter sp. Y-19]
MDEILNWTIKLAPLMSSLIVPAASLWINFRNERQDPSAVHAMKQNAKLYDSLPEDARESIERLIKFQAAKYSKEMIRKESRQANWSGRVALIFVAVLTSVSLYLLIMLALSWPWAYIFVAIVAFFGGGLMIAGGLQWFKYPDEEEPASSAGGDADTLDAPIDTQEKTEA